MDVRTYPTEAATATVALKPEVAIAHFLGANCKHQLKCFTVVQDGEVWRWRCSYPHHPGKLATVSTMGYTTRGEAVVATRAIAHMERPSICMVDAWQHVPADAGQPDYMREGWVGE